MAIKQILCIGASKNIGYHILERLAPKSEQYKLFVLARTPASSITPFVGKDNVTFVSGDAKKEENIRKVINSDMQRKVDYVVISVGICSAPLWLTFRWNACLQ
jgi:short-subunit dehydrogenase